MSWRVLIDDADDVSVSTLLPASLRDVWEDSVSDAAPDNDGQAARQYHVSRAASCRSSHIGSVPAAHFRLLVSYVPKPFYYSVYFHENRTGVLAADSFFDSGDWVIVVADRGFDLGQIIGQCEPPPSRERRTLKAIIRKATPREVDMIPGKEQREATTPSLCQARVRELGLAMQITGAEIQFDGMKVTFYYNAIKYVDFRDLLRSLFKAFGTRIWMVWCDQQGPVKDVITRRGRDLVSPPLDA
jgi:hypothetical protein